MLQISHLYADYGGKPALEDINLTLESGELLVVLGPSGCGKTTLLNLIAGFVPYQHGSIQLAGKRIEGPGAERGVVFQNEGLLPWRNVQDNVAFGLQLAGIEKMQRLEIAHQMLKKVGLEGAEKRYIWQLSGGQRQRVGIARALAQRFGELHIHPVYPHAEGVDEIIVLDTHNDNPPDNDNWHTDVTFIETPPAGAILAAKELPSTGGDTLWTSGIAAYEALSVPFRQLLSGLRAEHDFRKSFPEYKYRKTEEEHQRWREAVAKNPPLLHPVVRTHPVSGKQALFVNEGFTTRIVDVSEKESEALLGFLFAHITKPEFQVRWRWQPNDIAIWDNRVTQHYANADYLPQRRIMHRATILGDKPFYRAG
ncbi:taurine dioxygenase [Escherichia coli]|nr:taurine dioxygenase [Escherichia coli]EFB3607799.1 taurine dioxygenase [Escherichia coli]EFN9268736.1 taurine dioxygenase [Escherichia coli]